MSRAGWKSLIAGTALATMVAAPVGAQDRPDIPDTAPLNSYFADVVNQPDGDVVSANAYGFALDPTGFGPATFYATNTITRIDLAPGVTNAAAIGGSVHEADRIKREAFTFTTINQRNFASIFSARAIRVITIGGIPTALSFGPYSNSSAEGCGAKIRMNNFVDADDSGPPFVDPADHFTNATAVVQCSEAGLTEVGVPSAGRDIFRAVFPPSNDGTGIKAKQANLPWVGP
jgi:hypothetical protein